MSMTKLDIRNTQGTLLTLPLDDVSDGLVLQDVGGLGPVKATLSASSYAGSDKSQFQSAKREARNITLEFGFQPDYVTTTVSSLRDRLYHFFMSKRKVFMRFFTSDGLEVDISGIVESCEPAIFTKEPTVNVSIMSYDVDFIALEPIEVEGDTVSDSTETTIVYEGSTEVGYVFVLNLNRTLSEFTIYHRPPDGTLLQLNFAGSLLSGDILTISTVEGNKYATLNRSGTVSSVMYGVLPGSKYTKFDQGDNMIRVYAEGAAIPYTITYTSLYGAL